MSRISDSSTRKVLGAGLESAFMADAAALDRISAQLPPPVSAGQPTPAGRRPGIYWLALGQSLLATVLAGWLALPGILAGQPPSPEAAAVAVLALIGLLLAWRLRRRPDASAVAKLSDELEEARQLRDELRQLVERLAETRHAATACLALQARDVMRDLDTLGSGGEFIGLGDAVEEWRNRALEMSETTGVRLTWTGAENGAPVWLDTLGQLRVAAALRQLLGYLMPRMAAAGDRPGGGLWIHLTLGDAGLGLDFSAPDATPAQAAPLAGRLPLALRGQLRRLGARYAIDEARPALHLRLDVCPAQPGLLVESIRVD